MEQQFVRYEASMPNGRGLHPGIFALANGLAKDGRLSAEDWASWRSANDHYDAAYADPSTVERSVYDRAINPTAQSWFKRTAADLVTGVEFYKDLLHRYGASAGGCSIRMIQEGFSTKTTSRSLSHLIRIVTRWAAGSATDWHDSGVTLRNPLQRGPLGIPNRGCPVADGSWSDPASSRHAKFDSAWLWSLRSAPSAAPAAA